MERITYRTASGEAFYSDAKTEADRLHFIADMEDILGDCDLDRSDQEALEEIFCRLNERRYNDYDGPSMSVSDVVVLSRAGKQSAWYCDSVGFQEVPEFLEGYHHE